MPEGFVIRPVAGDHEISTRASAHREAFAPSRFTDELYLRLRRHWHEYNPELDLAAVAPDGTIASYCICWLDPVNKIGEFEPVGTRPAYQRQGLARAVLLEGLRCMKAAGMETAFVATGHANPGAQKLYESTGFRVSNRDWEYIKQL